MTPAEGSPSMTLGNGLQPFVYPFYPVNLLAELIPEWSRHYGPSHIPDLNLLVSLTVYLCFAPLHYRLSNGP